ncbi:FkbM family methyltransferase [Stieleria mannarensis]|uniref:FkbM family methyltransferase n=1 Tax=Stieleria mannarensis TaxID=2755585 RepID=UPI0016047B07|nr:FkbM family methyltransferase [Rhodopirellula sp. JC639]
MILNTLRYAGWDVRRISALPAIKKAEQEARSLEKWRFLQRYNAQTILDIGANVGQFARIARHWNSDALLVSFEPLADCADVLEKLSAELAPHRLIRTALGSSTGKSQIHHNQSSPSSSLLEMNSLHREELPHTSESWVETIEIQRLDDVFAEPLEPPVFVKIDVQGFEREVIEGGAETIANAEAVVMEVSLQSLYKDAPTFDELYGRMRTMGFHYRGNVDQWVSRADGRILQCDCLFER